MDLHANPVPDALSGTDYFRTRCFPVDQVQHVADQIRASLQIQYRLMVVGEDDLAGKYPDRNVLLFGCIPEKLPLPRSGS